MKNKKEIVICVQCGYSYECEPNNPADLCECPECKKNFNN